MELYTINGTTAAKQDLIESVNSIIWTERYSNHGDCQVVVRPTPWLERRLVPGALLGFSESTTPMLIRSAKVSTNADNQRVMEVEGDSISKILEYRKSRPYGSSQQSFWYKATARDIITALVYNTSVVPASGYASAGKVPGLAVYNDPSVPTLPILDVILEMGTAWERIKELLDDYDLGFSMTLPVLGTLSYFAVVYKGKDVSNSVVFGGDTETLSEITKLQSDESYASYAYAFNDSFGSYMYGTAPGDVTKAGFGFREIVVDASDIQGTVLDVQAAVQSRARAVLSQNKKIDYMDGKVNPDNPAKMGLDYNLGDIVQIRDVDGDPQKMRVSEFIRSFDEQGYREYPTLEYLGAT